MLEDSSNWTDWTPTKLCSEKSEKLQLSDNLETEELIFEDVENVFDTESSKENNPVTNKLPQSNLKYKKSKKTKQLQKKLMNWIFWYNPK